MRLRNTKRGAPEKGDAGDNLEGEEVNADIINMACCGGLSSNGSKDPIVVSSIEKEDSEKVTKEEQFVEDEVSPSVDGCLGEGVLTQVINFIDLKFQVLYFRVDFSIGCIICVFN